MPTCAHCGESCVGCEVHDRELSFCCNGCLTVYRLLHDNNLAGYYAIVGDGGVSLKGQNLTAGFEYLDDPAVSRRLLDFTDGTLSRVTLHVPQMYCSACIWLLENLSRLNGVIVESRVNFPKRQLSVTFREPDLSLRRVVELLAALGYSPRITLGDLEKHSFFRDNRRLILMTGVAGFCFANIMLFSFPDYLATVGNLPREFAAYFGYLSLLLSLPVLFYSAGDFFRNALTGLRQRQINLDVPISIGILALFLRSAYEIISAAGTGYLDSMSGLVFFLLIGRVVQAKTYQALSFDRDYRSYFPLCITRIRDGREQQVGVQRLEIGDRILVRNGELIVADAVLIGEAATVDYSFVTGESTPVVRRSGETLFAGGRIVGAAALMDVIKEVSQSYLVSLWNSDRFARRQESAASRISLVVGRYFTITVVALALATFAFWLPSGIDSAVTNAVAVLIVACPCALALALPFTLGTTMTIFGRGKFFLRDQNVIEKMAALSTVVFDKTGTLTESELAMVNFRGRDLTETELAALRALLRQSTHPLARAIRNSLEPGPADELGHFEEIPGKGAIAQSGETILRLGAASWLNHNAPDTHTGARAYLQINGEVAGYFALLPSFRQATATVVPHLRHDYELWLLSGDNPAQADDFLPLFAGRERMRFQQSPHDKLNFIADLRQSGQQVLMVGDGLNDSGALAAADVGIAVTDGVAAFAPACDAMMSADALPHLPAFLHLSRDAMRTVKAAFALSLLYNGVGLYFAITGSLSPLIAAILMPISSLSVVAFAVLGTRWAAYRRRLL